MAEKAKRERLKDRKDKREEQKKLIEANKASMKALQEQLYSDDDEDSSGDEEDADKVEKDRVLEFSGASTNTVVVTESMSLDPKEAGETAHSLKVKAWQEKSAKAKEMEAAAKKPKTYINQLKKSIRHRGKTQTKRNKKKK